MKIWKYGPTKKVKKMRILKALRGEDHRYKFDKGSTMIKRIWNGDAENPEYAMYFKHEYYPEPGWISEESIWEVMTPRFYTLTALRDYVKTKYCIILF